MEDYCKIHKSPSVPSLCNMGGFSLKTCYPTANLLAVALFVFTDDCLFIITSVLTGNCF